MADLKIYKYDIPYSKYGETFDGVLFQDICVNGVPINLNNAVVDIDFRKQKTGSRSQRLSTLTGEVAMVQPNAILIKNDFILSLLPASYFYDVRVTYPDGTIAFYIEGTHLVSESVTRDI